MKKVIFPLEVLPWVALGSALFHAGVSVVVLLVCPLVLRHTLPWTAVLFPLVLVPLVLTTVGLAGSSRRWASMCATSARRR